LTIAFTLSRHGTETGLPVSNTTMVLGFAAATASITASWRQIPKVEALARDANAENHGHICPPYQQGRHSGAPPGVEIDLRFQKITQRGRQLKGVLGSAASENLTACPTGTEP